MGSGQLSIHTYIHTYITEFVLAGFRFHIFYCNSAGFSNGVRYNGLFVIAGFVIAGRHCSKCKLKKYLFGGKNERKTGEFRYSMTITIRPLVA